MPRLQKCVIAAAVVALLGLGGGAAAADDEQIVTDAGYLPAPCEDLRAPDWVYCPSPFIEMVGGTDAVNARVWWCSETDFSLGLPHGDIQGCWSPGDANMLSKDGWRLPPVTKVAQAGYRGEIMEHVIDPCFLEGVRDHGLDEQLGEQEALKLMKMMQAEQVDAMVGVLLPLVEGHDQPTRLAIYTMSYAHCINGMRGG